MREARARQDGKPLSDDDRKAVRTLGLNTDADRKILRARYAELVRKYHPDRNGGDRSHEKALQDVISAYTQLRKAPAFASFLDAACLGRWRRIKALRYARWLCKRRTAFFAYDFAHESGRVSWRERVGT